MGTQQLPLSTPNPVLVGARTPTPRIVYEPRIWKLRIWVQNGPFEGVPATLKCPYGVAINAAELLTRACARYQIRRYQLAPMTPRGLKKLDRTKLERYEDAFERIGREYEIDWSA